MERNLVFLVAITCMSTMMFGMEKSLLKEESTAKVQSKSLFEFILPREEVAHSSLVNDPIKRVLERLVHEEKKAADLAKRYQELADDHDDLKAEKAAEKKAADRKIVYLAKQNKNLSEQNKNLSQEKVSLEDKLDEAQKEVQAQLLFFKEKHEKKR